MKFHGPSPLKKITTIENTPLWFGIVSKVAAVLAGAIALEATKRAFNMEEVTFKYEDRIIEEEPPTKK